MAWLFAAPQGGGATRNEMFKRQGIRYKMPALGNMRYLVDYLAEIGEAKLAGSELTPNGWVDIVAWQEATGLKLEPRDAKALKMLSEAYVLQHVRSKDKNCMEPGRRVAAPDVDEKIRKMVRLLRP